MTTERSNHKYSEPLEKPDLKEELSEKNKKILQDRSSYTVRMIVELIKEKINFSLKRSYNPKEIQILNELYESVSFGSFYSFIEILFDYNKFKLLDWKTQISIYILQEQVIERIIKFRESHR